MCVCWETENCTFSRVKRHHNHSNKPCAAVSHMNQWALEPIYFMTCHHHMCSQNAWACTVKCSFQTTSDTSLLIWSQTLIYEAKCLSHMPLFCGSVKHPVILLTVNMTGCWIYWLWNGRWSDLFSVLFRGSTLEKSLSSHKPHAHTHTHFQPVTSYPVITARPN